MYCLRYSATSSCFLIFSNFCSWIMYWYLMISFLFTSSHEFTSSCRSMPWLAPLSRSNSFYGKISAQNTCLVSFFLRTSAAYSTLSASYTLLFTFFSHFSAPPEFSSLSLLLAELWGILSLSDSNSSDESSHFPRISSLPFLLALSYLISWLATLL